MAGGDGSIGNRWWEQPPGHASVAEAASVLDLSTQRIHQLVANGELPCRRTTASRNGRRSRVWIPQHAIDRRLAASRPRSRRRGSPPTGPGSAAAPLQNLTGSLETVLQERDRWRAEALRLREAGRLITLAFDALHEASTKHADAQAHQREANACLDSALDSARQASAYQTDAVRQFLLPADPAEN